MRIVLLLLALAPSLVADLRSSGRSIDQIDLYADLGLTGYGGDTPHFTAWTGSSTGGNWNGGHIYGSFNDGHGWCSGGGNIGMLEVTRIDWNTKSNTNVVCANAMSSYGGASQINVPSGWTDGNTWKSYNMFSYNGMLYWFVYRQNQSAPYQGSMSTVITSPDNGLHWCNPATYAAHAGAPGCDATNWSANGDAPSNAATAMNWGAVNNPANPLARPMIVQFCQDQSCTGSPFSADSYLYFATMDGSAKLYASCVAKSAAAIMSSSQWWYWKGGNGNCGDTNSWTQTASAAIGIQNGDNSIGYPSSVIYVPQAGQFLMTSYDWDSRVLFATSQYPWGPFKRMVLSPVGGQGNFVTANAAWLDATCSGCTTAPGRWQLTVAATITGHTPDLSLNFYKFDISNGGPSTPATRPGGIGYLGRTKVRVSKDGLNKRMVSNGLRLAFGFDEFQDYPSAALSSRGTFVRDMLGSSACVVSGSTPTGSLTYGAQNATVPISLSYNGIYVGPQYSGQFTSTEGGCTGALPLSGNAAFTVIWIGALDSVTRNQGMLWEMFDPTQSATAHRNIAFGTNLNFEGGTHIDFYDGNVTLRTAPTLANGNHYMITMTKAPGATVGNVKIYVGTTSQTITVNGTTDGASLNLFSSLKLLMGCAAFATPSRCGNGGSGPFLGATYDFFALYDRALSAEEVARTYAALKAALAQPPRSITLQ